MPPRLPSGLYERLVSLALERQIKELDKSRSVPEE
jgi:hypothetical protein